MTLQEIFDKVVAPLLKQGRKSLLTTYEVCVGCAYRGDDGAKCSVGWLIPDDKYDPSFEGQIPDSSSPELRAVLLSEGVNMEDFHTGLLIEELQDLHDHHKPEKWAQIATEIASHHNLDTSVIDNHIKRTSNGHKAI